MWTVVYMTKNEQDAIKLTDKLKKNEVISKIRKNDLFFEIFVPSAELDSAHKIIIDTNM